MASYSRGRFQTQKAGKIGTPASRASRTGPTGNRLGLPKKGASIDRLSQGLSTSIARTSPLHGW